MMKSLRLVLGCALLLTTAATQLEAAPITITFEGFNNNIYIAPITRSGYDIGNPVGQLQHFHEITSTGFLLPNNGTGVLLNDRNTEIFVVGNAGSGITTFSLTSVDVATALGNGPAVGITITGSLGGVPTGTVNLASLGTGYTTLSGGSLGIVDRLVFDGIGGSGGFVLDNLALNDSAGAVIPEPSTLILAGLGLLGVGGFQWRKRRKA
jgi:hypothetical protein